MDGIRPSMDRMSDFGSMTGIISMEPMLPDLQAGLEDRILEFEREARSLGEGLNVSINAAIGDVVRSLDSHYSNSIEGHHIPLVDIERSLEDDNSNELERRDLQIEAKAHVQVQKMIDRGEMPFTSLSVDGIRWIHREFYSRLPDNLVLVRDSANDMTIRTVPGELRTRHVMVSRHVAPAPDDVPALLLRFVQAYSTPMLSKPQRMLGVAASHHRLAWIHPFLDGNGRVVRLFSHALFRELGCRSELWSVSRGLARNVARYRQLLQAADQGRRGDRDGRGTLTEAGLADFCRFFFDVCIDQIQFMKSLLVPDGLMNRVGAWADGEVQAQHLPYGAARLLREAILTGELEVSRASELLSCDEKQTRATFGNLMDKGLLVSETSDGTLRLGFPAATMKYWLPGL